jgi:hypothetical protein
MFRTYLTSHLLARTAQVVSLGKKITNEESRLILGSSAYGIATVNQDNPSLNAGITLVLFTHWIISG